MADHVAITAGTGTTVATDEISSVHYQRVKLDVGAEGVASGPVCTANPLPISDAGGSLTVDGTVVVSSLPTVTVAAHAVTNAGTFVIQEDGAALIALQLIDDAVHAEDAAHVTADKGVMMLGVRQNTLAALTSADGDYTPPSFDSAGRMYVNAGSVELDITPASPDATDFNVVRLTNGTAYAEVGTEYEEGATDAAISGVAILWEDTSDTLRAVSAAKPLPITIIGSGGTGTSAADDADFTAGTTTGTAAMGVYEPSPTSITSGDMGVVGITIDRRLRVETSGTVAHDAVSTGNAVRVGAKAESSLSGLTLVADGDKTDLFAGLDGVLLVRTECNLEDVVQERTTNTDGASTAFASGLAAPGASIRLWIKSVTICNSSATFCTVDLRDGSAGSVLWTFPVPATGGVTHVFNPPLKLTANTALAFDASASTTTLTVSANGFKSKL